MNILPAVSFDADLIRRYDRPGPRYTSYPTAVQFRPDFGADDYLAAVEASREAGAQPLSLYVHIPFCTSPCFYCACSRIITRSREKAERYLERLKREIEMQGALFGGGRTVEQLHFGGGTPTFLDADQLGGLMEHLARHFPLTNAPDREYSIEIDPRSVGTDAPARLAAMGFNRMSLGVQDFDPEVQRAVNRVQPVTQTLRLIESARSAGFGSISLDLIYGLPLQTPERFARTLDTVIAACPDRLSVYAYAHMPHLFKPQKRIRAEDLPGPETRLALLALTIEKLTSAGYVYIGMDHFALPQDELVRAQREGTLQRNFQGYSTRAYCDLVGLGVTSIGRIGDVYAQNCKKLEDYYAAVDAGRLPIQRGIALDFDDRVRRAVIQELMCHAVVDRDAIGTRFGIDFDDYFRTELERLRSLESDGLVEIGERQIAITAAGRLLMRNVAMVFDAYLPPPTAQVHSRAI